MTRPGDRAVGTVDLIINRRRFPFAARIEKQPTTMVRRGTAGDYSIFTSRLLHTTATMLQCICMRRVIIIFSPFNSNKLSQQTMPQCSLPVEISASLLSLPYSPEPNRSFTPSRSGHRVPRTAIMVRGGKNGDRQSLITYTYRWSASRAAILLHTVVLNYASAASSASQHQGVPDLSTSRCCAMRCMITAAEFLATSRQR